jgi:hypothetical protein
MCEIILASFHGRGKMWVFRIQASMLIAMRDVYVATLLHLIDIVVISQD